MTPLPCHVDAAHEVRVEMVESAHFDIWDVFCPVCIDLGSPNGRGHSREDAIEDWNRQIEERA